MSDNVTKALEIAAAIFFVCLTVTLFMRNYLLTAEYSKANAEALIDARLEYETSGLAALEGVKLKGSRVLNAVRKYKDQTTVKVQNVSGAPMLFDHTTGTVVNVTATGETKIPPDGVYVCTHTENLNGVVTEILFTQNGVITVDESTYTVDDVRTILQDRLMGVDGTTASSSLTELFDTISNNVSLESKQRLVGLVSGLVSNADIDTIVDKLEAKQSQLNGKITELQGKLSASYELKEGTVNPIEDITSSEDPDSVFWYSSPSSGIVTDDTTREKYFYDGSSFYLAETPEVSTPVSSGLTIVTMQINGVTRYYLGNNLGHNVSYQFYFKNN